MPSGRLLGSEMELVPREVNLPALGPITMAAASAEKPPSA